MIFGKTFYSKAWEGICFRTLGCVFPASHSPGTGLAAVTQIPLVAAHTHEESPTSLLSHITSLTKLKLTGSVGRRESLSEACQW